jgi:hypothetical protein
VHAHVHTGSGPYLHVTDFKEKKSIKSGGTFSAELVHRDGRERSHYMPASLDERAANLIIAGCDSCP